jgi:hypothetical protein
MAVPTSIADLDPVAINNSPAGSDSIGTSLDDYLRSHAAIVRNLYDDLLDGTVDVHTALNANSATTSTKSTNVAGGLGGSIPYQSAVDTTALLANGTSGQVLTSQGGTSAPVWSSVSGIPVGTIIDFAGTSAPAGYLACPTASGGAQLQSRTTYAALFTAIGTTWGAGDGSTTFGIPWFAANYAAVQANANVGTASVGEVIAHTHTAPTVNNQQITPGGSSFTMSAGNTGSTGGSANLAAGVRVLKCVKF